MASNLLATDRCAPLTIEMGNNIGLGHGRVVSFVKADGLILSIGESATRYWSHGVGKTEFLQTSSESVENSGVLFS